MAADLHVSEIRLAGQMLIVSFNNWIGLKLTGGAFLFPLSMPARAEVVLAAKPKMTIRTCLTCSHVLNLEGNQAAKP